LKREGGSSAKIAINQKKEDRNKGWEEDALSIHSEGKTCDFVGETNCLDQNQVAKPLIC